MSVEELVKRLRDGCNLQQRDGEVAADKLEELDTHRRKVLAENERFLRALIEANIKLAELAAENERLRGDCRSYEKTMAAIEIEDAKDKAALAEAKRENEALRELVRWVHDTLYEINPSNYDHDEVCKLNDASVEVILGLAPTLGETHGYTKEWWAARNAGGTDADR